ncbi:MAG: dienelactone hydrolase family protein [Sandaracinaceae bacterium]
MSMETVSYSEGEDLFDMVLALPEAEGPRPSVLVFHAWGGRDAFAEDKARLLAELGYVGAAVDLYGVGRRGGDKAESAALMNEALSDPARLRRRLAAAFQAVRIHAAVDPERVAGIGYCFGGLCALLAARMGLPLRAVVSFHGLLKIGESLDGPVHARLLVQHGQDDPMVPPADVGAFAEEMKRANADWQLHAYPGVMHAFTNPAANDPDFGTVYDADADARSWSEMARFLAENLA